MNDAIWEWSLNMADDLNVLCPNQCFLLSTFIFASAITLHDRNLGGEGSENEYSKNEDWP